MATPSRAEANIFDTWNDSTRGLVAWEIIRGAPAAAVAGMPSTLERLKQAPAFGYYQPGPAQSQFPFERPINIQAVI
jgi:hypothetical protein